MANIGKDYFTYSDLAKKMISSGNEVIGKVIEILSQTNQIIDDIPMIQCNNGDIHKTLIRSGLPEGYWRSINQGVPNSKSDTVQVSDKCAQLASNFQVDKDLVDLNNNSRDFMASEERAHLEKQAQTMAKALFYSDYDADDTMFMGLAPRYSTLDPEVAPSAANVIDARPDIVARLQPDFNQLAKAKRDIEALFGSATFVVPNLEMQEVLKRGRGYAAWDVDTLLSICLNMGNDANLYRLTGMVKNRTEVDSRADCYNFTEQDLAVIAGLFDAATWRSIQNIWDGIGSLYDQLDAVTYRITNRHVVKEPAMPLTVMTSDGEALALKGGYFPAINDPFLSNRAGQLAEGSGIEDAIHSGVMGSVHQVTRPAAGMIRERLRDEDGNPVVRLPQMLKTDIMIKHLAAATHYISHAETILEFDRLTRHPEWRAMYIDKFGQAQYRAVRNWLQNLARPNRMDNSAGGRFMEQMRTLSSKSSSAALRSARLRGKPC